MEGNRNITLPMVMIRLTIGILTVVLLILTISTRKNLVFATCSSGCECATFWVPGPCSVEGCWAYPSVCIWAWARTELVNNRCVVGDKEGGNCASGCSCGGGCFVEGTEVATKELKDGETEKLKNIAELEPGEIVSSFNPETGKISESQVAEVHKVTREGYYELETESGKKVKVTGEHPFLAVKSEGNLISKLKNALSNSLTLRLITTFQTKLIEVLD